MCGMKKGDPVASLDPASMTVKAYSPDLHDPKSAYSNRWTFCSQRVVAVPEDRA
jgi:hypothetical protein